MSFRVAQFNILGRHMAGTMWFHYARDFLPSAYASEHPDWTRAGGFPRSLLWQPSEGVCRFHRFPVLLAEMRALCADVLCLVELDCFQEFQTALASDGYDAVFHARPGKLDGCGIFWRRDVFAAVGEKRTLVYAAPAHDRLAVTQVLEHLATQKKILVVSTHLHWDQEAGHQAAEAEELLALVRSVEDAAGVDGATVICADLNATPTAPAYELMRRRFCDASLEENAGYPAGSFTSIKPDVYYFAWPRGMRGVPNVPEEWHFQEGRQEVIDYVFYDGDSFALASPASVPSLGNGAAEPSAAKRSRLAATDVPYGFWAGGWAFEASPAPGWEERRRDPTWMPRRAEGQLQLGIPNRIHGSDHLPVVCTLQLRVAARPGLEAGGELAAADEATAAETPRSKRGRAGAGL